MENIIILDTGIIIDFFGGRKIASEVEKLLAESCAAISAITVYELFNGVSNKDHIRQREQLLKLCEIVKIDEHMARKASSIFTSLKAKGKLICNEDILIASCALSKTYSLFTNNKKHYTNIPGLNLYGN
ncbi:MAG: type II toxin-antitoxin system VapC family toxin [Candidatus Anammoxibacter sp.]